MRFGKKVRIPKLKKSGYTPAKFKSNADRTARKLASRTKSFARKVL